MSAPAPSARGTVTWRIGSLKFNFSFLALFRPSPFGTWDGICLSGLAVVQDATTRADALSQLTCEVREYSTTEAIGYIRSHAADSTRLMCPEGTINLVADDWFCKHTGRRCPIGSIVDRSDVDASLSRCDAPTKVKNGIPAAFTDGYAGLHHTNGRYLCPLCSSRKNSRYRVSSYRYPFELQSLVDVLRLQNDIVDSAEVRRELVLNRINVSVMSNACCAHCLQRVIAQIAPALAGQLEIVEIAIDI